MTNGLKFACAAAAAVFITGVAGAALFEPLFKFTEVSGDVRVFRPGAAESVPAANLHAYPYGSRVVVPKWDGNAKKPKPYAIINLSNLHKIGIGGGSELVIMDAAVKPSDNKVVEIRNGSAQFTVSVSTVKTGITEKDQEIEDGINALVVRLPNDIAVTRLTGKAAVSVARNGENTDMRFFSESEMMTVSGPQFVISPFRKNSEMEIQGHKDFTRITGVAGDFTCEVERGVDDTETVRFRKNTVVKIWRSYAKIGGKMAVAVMVVMPNGTLKSYAFLEGQKVAEGTGELTTSETVSDFGDNGFDFGSGTGSDDDDPFSAGGGTTSTVFDFDFTW